MAKVKSSIEEEPADSFTSMIDIVFLLLIFFILQPFKSPEKKLRSELPRDEGPSSSITPPRPNINVKIRVGNDPDKAIFSVNDRPCPANSLHTRLKQESEDDAEVPVALNPSVRVHFKYVLKALDQCAKAQMKNVKWLAPYEPKPK